MWRCSQAFTHLLSDPTTAVETLLVSEELFPALEQRYPPVLS